MAIYHLSVRGGTRAKGSVATRKSDYIQRERQYENQPDRCVYRESGNMPGWAEENPRDYWRAADEHERANGRLYVEIEVALPRELDQERQVELAREFAHEVTGDSNLPYTLAVHEGRGRDGRGDNPHAHLMISERQNDGIDRDRDDWFRRANTHDPEDGGAPKTREFHGGQQITGLRELWADELNRALELERTHELDRDIEIERVDHRSLEAQGIDRAPGLHLGPGVYAALEKGEEPERYLRHQEIQGLISNLEEELAHVREHERTYREIDQERGYERTRDLDLGY